MRELPAKGERYRHFKGNEYETMAVARHSETMEELVVYFPVSKPESVFARPLTMFMSPVDREKYPDVKQEYRFEKIADAAPADTASSDDDGLETVHPMLLEFLDAETYADKLVVFDKMKTVITDEMIDAIAVSLDTEVDKLPLEERYRQIKEILLLQESYENTRLRG